MSNKYSQNLHTARKSTTVAITTASKRAIQKTRKTVDLTGNKIADKITNLSKQPPKELHSKELHSAELQSQNDEANNKIEIPKRRHVSLEKKATTIDELRLV